MANIKSSAKRDLKSKELRAKNRADKTELKTMVKKFDAAVAEGNKDNAVNAYKVAVKTVDRAAAKGLLHKNNAAHKKSANCFVDSPSVFRYNEITLCISQLTPCKARMFYG